MRFRSVFCLCITLVAFFAATALTGVPQLINFQGILLDPAGDPVTTPSNVTFAIWNAETDGDSLWSETQLVTPDDEARFNVLLGTVSPVPDSVFEGDAYLGVKVKDDPEMSPRSHLVTVPYSYRVGTVDGASGGDISGNVDAGGFTVGGVPVGTSTDSYWLQNGSDIHYNVGNVGIGTAMPTEQLEVDGNLMVSGVLAASPRVYTVENNDQVTKSDDTWTDYLTTTITVDKDNSNVFVFVDLSGCREWDQGEIAFRAKVADHYSNPSLLRYNRDYVFQKPHFTFLLSNIPKGTYTAGVEWRALDGNITTSYYHQGYAYNKVVFVVL